MPNSALCLRALFRPLTTQFPLRSFDLAKFCTKLFSTQTSIDLCLKQVIMFFSLIKDQILHAKASFAYEAASHVIIRWQTTASSFLMPPFLRSRYLPAKIKIKSSDAVHDGTFFIQYPCLGEHCDTLQKRNDFFAFLPPMQGQCVMRSLSEDCRGRERDN